MEVRDGYKETEIGIIPDDWNVKNLGEITKIYVGKDLKEEHFSGFQDNFYKFPVYSNTVDNEGLYGYYNVSEYEGESLTIVGRGVGLGTTFKRSGGYGAIGRLLVLFPKYKINTSFLSEYINQRVNIFSESNAIPQLTGISIASYKIALPTLAEQTAIANALSDADNYIASLSALIAKKRLIKQGAMQELLRPKEGWVVKKLGEIIKLKNGYAFSSLYFSNSGPIVITPGNFKLEGGLNFNDNNTIRYSGKIEKDMLFQKGDLIIVMTDLTPTCNLLGKPGIVTSDGNILHNQRIGKITIIDKSLNQHYLYWFFASEIFSKRMKETATGSTVRHTSVGSIFNSIITFPPIEEQTHIATILSDMDSEIEALEKKLEKARQIKQGMMQQLLTGKIRLV